MSSATAVVDADDAFDGDGSASVSEPRLRLTALSFLMLFLELALIRWTAANNIHLAYLTNFVLLASFLGIGIGFLRARSGPNLFPFTPIALGLMVVFVHVFPVDLTTFIGQNQLQAEFGFHPLRRPRDRRQTSTRHLAPGRRPDLPDRGHVQLDDRH